MPKSRVLAGLLCLASLVAASPLGAQPSGEETEQAEEQDQSVVVAVVLDGPSAGLSTLASHVAQETLAITKTEFEVRFAADKQVTGDWTAAGVKKAVDGVLADPDVDVVIGMGPIASYDLARRKSLPKKAIAPFLIGPTLQGLTKKDEPFKRKNLSHVVWSLRLERDLKAFRELGEFDDVALLTNAAVARAIPGLDSRLRERAAAVGVNLSVVPVEGTADSALSALPPDVDAVYVGPNPQLTSEQIDKLIAGLIERRLPSFSWLGRVEVERGMLAGLGAPDDLKRLVRRVALNTQSILLGQPPEELATGFEQGEQLCLNMSTARAVGVWPNWTTITDAILINDKSKKVGRKLTLASVVDEAMKSNLDLAVARQQVLASEHDVRKARAGLLPRLELSADGTWIDDDRAGSSQAERTLSWSLMLSQSLYNERTWANHNVQSHLQAGRRHGYEAAKLDLARNVSVAYLNVLTAQTVERIRRENLAQTRQHLAVARVRKQSGAAGPSEVFRWESQIAQSRREVIDAVALRNQTEIQLNGLLNRPLEESFITREAALEDAGLLSSEQRFARYLGNPLRFKVFREFMVKEGLGEAPELKQLTSALAAQDRQTESHERSVWMPSFGLAAGTTHRFLQDGAGSEPAAVPPSLAGAFPSPDNFDWFVGLNATVPLYEGGARYAAIDQSKADASRISLEKRAAAQKVEQRIRTAMHGLGASFAAIGLSRDAAEAARNSLDVARDAYSQGAVSQVTLIDAQNQALVAELAAAAAVYEFLIDLMDVERAVGRLDFFQDGADVSRFFDRVDAYERKRQRDTGARPAVAAGAPR